MKRTKLNLTIDVLMFVFMMAVAGIGFLMKYVLLPGFKRFEVYGRDVELFFWGIDRHQWGTIHLILSFVLLFLLLLHIIFHWKQIINIFISMVPAKGIRVFITIILVIISLILFIVPLFVNPEVQEGGGHHGGHSSSEGHEARGVIEEPILKDTINSSIATTHNSEIDHESELEIYGYMTLNEVAEKYNIPVEELATAINVSIAEKDEKLGRLKKQYGFQLQELRDYVELKTTKQ